MRRRKIEYLTEYTDGHMDENVATLRADNFRAVIALAVLHIIEPLESYKNVNRVEVLGIRVEEE